jgi:hypothetical protein
VRGMVGGSNGDSGVEVTREAGGREDAFRSRVGGGWAKGDEQNQARCARVRPPSPD